MFITCEDLTIPLVGEILYVLEFDAELLADHEDTLKGFLSALSEARPELDISRADAFPCRRQVIEKAFKKMGRQVREVVQPKLPVGLLREELPTIRREPPTMGREPPIMGRGPPTMRKESQRKERELPRNWREPWNLHERNGSRFEAESKSHRIDEFSMVKKKDIHTFREEERFCCQIPRLRIF